LDFFINKFLFFGLLAQLYGAKFVLGVDIDNTLIQAAWRRRRAVWSTQGPTSPNLWTDQSDKEMVSDAKHQARPNYFPASCEHEFSFLPIPPAENRGKEIFPHNISFRTADWVKTNIPEDKEGYDVVVGFVIICVILMKIYIIRILQVFHLEMDTHK
jgi:7SK snRNA methylphosphate capping enzyme